jgi:hypothetical protein
LAKPCPAGTHTLQETPGFAWRTRNYLFRLPYDHNSIGLEELFMVMDINKNDTYPRPGSIYFQKHHPSRVHS